MPRRTVAAFCARWTAPIRTGWWTRTTRPTSAASWCSAGAGSEARPPSLPSGGRRRLRRSGSDGARGPLRGKGCGAPFCGRGSGWWYSAIESEPRLMRHGARELAHSDRHRHWAARMTHRESGLPVYCVCDERARGTTRSAGTMRKSAWASGRRVRRWFPIAVARGVTWVLRNPARKRVWDLGQKPERSRSTAARHAATAAMTGKETRLWTVAPGVHGAGPELP